MYEQPFGAVFSRNRRHRYMLWRTWDTNRKRKAIFVGLNPSTADEHVDDPTIRRCQSFARGWRGKWRCGGLFVVNLYSFCSPSPAELFRSGANNSPTNQRWLKKLCTDPDALVIGMWGNHGLRNDSGVKFSYWASSNNIPIHCLAVNTTGTPAHPLYLRKGLKPRLLKIETTTEKTPGNSH